MSEIIKYPRTAHLEGSKLQDGDEDLSQVRLSSLVGKRIVIEEKVDGANCGVSFTSEANMKLQCRGHFLTGGAGETQFAWFKQWCAAWKEHLFDLLEDRYIMYGGWLYAKHTVFYDHLPHYFLEFDVYDKRCESFLGTRERQAFLTPCPWICSVLVLDTLEITETTKIDKIERYVEDSFFKTPRWKPRLVIEARKAGYDEEKALIETDPSTKMEGLYIKVEENGTVTERLKWVRGDFIQAIIESGSHWKARPIIPNQLAEGVNLWHHETSLGRMRRIQETARIRWADHRELM